MNQKERAAYTIVWNLDFGSVWSRSYKDGEGLIHNFNLPVLKNTKWKLNLFMEHRYSEGGGLKARLTRMEDGGPHEIEIEAEICLLSSEEGPDDPFSEIHRFKTSKFKHSEESEMLTFIDSINLKENLLYPIGGLRVRFQLKPNNFDLSYPVTHIVRTTSTSRFFTKKLEKSFFLKQNKTEKFVLEGIINDDPNLTLELHVSCKKGGKDDVGANIEDYDVLGAEITSDKRESHLQCYFYVFDENGCLEIPVENSHHNFEDRDVWDITGYKRSHNLLGEPLQGFSIDNKTVHFEIRKYCETPRVTTELDEIKSVNADSSMNNWQNLITFKSIVYFGAAFALLYIFLGNNIKSQWTH